MSSFTNAKEEVREARLLIPSPLQNEILNNHLRFPLAGPDVNQMIISLNEELRITEFQNAWEILFSRYEILGTVFRLRPGSENEYLREIYSRVILPFTILDWSDNTKDFLIRLEEFIEKDRITAFQTDAPPLFRLTLIRKDRDSYSLVWTYHRTLLDRQSVSLLLKEVFHIYRDLCEDKEPSLPEPINFTTYTEWLESQIYSQASENYWRSYLKGFTAITPLVTCTPPHRENGQTNGAVKFGLTKKVNTSLARIAKERGWDRDILFYAGWAILLSRYSGEEDILFGILQDGRLDTLKHSNEIVGLVKNLLPLRIQIDGEALLSNTLEILGDSIETQRGFHYNSLTQIQGWSEIDGDSALFESVVIYEKDDIESSLPLTGAEWGSRKFDLREKRCFPLMLQICDKEEISFSLRYDPQRFDDDTMLRMAGHLQTLLERMAAGLEKPLSQLSPATVKERGQILEEWNDTKAEFPHDECMHHLFEEQAVQSKDEIAVIYSASDNRQQLTYGELNEKANRLAHYLQAKGVGPEVCVGVCLERSLEMIIAVMAVIKAGGAYVPMDPLYPADRIGYILERSLAPVVLTQQKVFDRLGFENIQALCLDTEWETIASYPDENPRSPVTPENLAYIIFTSGSTGMPKGVAIEHRGAVNTIYDVNRQFDVKKGDRGFGISSLSFDLSVYDIFGLLASGGTLVLPRSSANPDPADWLRVLNQEKVTLWNSAPALMQALADFAGDSGVKLPQSLRLVMMSGDWIPVALPEKIKADIKDIEVISLGGATEASIWSIIFPIESQEKHWKSIPYGKPMKNQKFYVLDKSLEPCPIWMPGDLFIAGDGLARCYWRDEEKTNASFITHPQSGERLYRTGDLGRYLSDGNIEFLGRSDFQVKIRGFRVELGEIETILEKVDWVQNCAVAAPKDGTGTRRLVGYVVPNGDVIDKESFLDLSNQLKEHLREKLPDYMVPGLFIQLEEMPLTPNGKVDRKGLQEPDFADTESEIETLGPRDDLEVQLIQIWKKILGVKQLGIRDNFSDLGGHSLLAVRLFAEVNKVIGKELPMTTLFQAQTVEEMAEVIRSEGDLSVSSAPVLLNNGGPGTPLFCIYGVYLYHDLARCFDGERPVYGVYSQVEIELLNEGGVEKMYELTIPDLAKIYIDEIRKVQPHGPYLLAGESFGGMVVFEIAQQLLNAGESVELVALLDTFIPGFANVINWRQRITIHWQQFLKAGFSYFVPSEVKHVPETSDPRNDFHSVEMNRYKAIPYPGSIVMFRALDNGPFEKFYTKPDLWKKYARGRVVFFDVPGDHIGILQKPNVSILADYIKKCI